MREEFVRARRALAYVRRMPKWALLRVATVSGVNVGWWIMAFWSAVVGAISAVVVVTIVHSMLKSRAVADVTALKE